MYSAHKTYIFLPKASLEAEIWLKLYFIQYAALVILAPGCSTISRTQSIIKCSETFVLSQNEDPAKITTVALTLNILEQLHVRETRAPWTKLPFSTSA